MVELKNTCFVLEPLHLGVTPCIQLYVAANHQNSRLLDSTIRLTNTFVGGHSFKVGWKRQTEFLITPAVRVDWLKRQTAN